MSLRRWSNIVLMLYKCFVFAGNIAATGHAQMVRLQICLNVTDEFVYNMYNIQPHSRDYPASIGELAQSWL